MGIITFFLIGITAVISLMAFNNPTLLNNTVLWPAAMHDKRQWYRFISSGFVHVNTMHLLVNMMTLYFFGPIVEQTIGGFRFLILYVTAIIIADIPSYIKQYNNPAYRSLGASGGIAAVVFASIYIDPWEKVGLLFIPVFIPSILFAALYLIYTRVMAARGGGFINHDAHFSGSIYGLLFMLIMDPTHGRYFIEVLQHPQL